MFRYVASRVVESTIAVVKFKKKKRRRRDDDDGGDGEESGEEDESEDESDDPESSGKVVPKVATNKSPNTIVPLKARYYQCDQIGQFIGLWATF